MSFHKILRRPHVNGIAQLSMGGFGDRGFGIPRGSPPPLPLVLVTSVGGGERVYNDE